MEIAFKHNTAILSYLLGPGRGPSTQYIQESRSQGSSLCKRNDWTRCLHRYAGEVSLLAIAVPFADSSSDKFVQGGSGKMKGN